jgi:hypothetical protein
LLAGEKSIREVIAFPKTAKAQDLMAEAPSSVDAEQMNATHIEFVDRFPCGCGGEWRISYEKFFEGLDTSAFPHAQCPVNPAVEIYPLPHIDPSGFASKMHRAKGSPTWVSC